MPSKPTLESLNTEVLALRAAVRALSRMHGRRSAAAMAELIQTFAEEAGRLGHNVPSFDGDGREAANRASSYLADLIAELMDESKAA
ncbi:hypothetical protein [Brevundimonas aveniformis]|uniref:hypothetical protein n=1 Tax=Brevundimonas aveniformis TaxID=370977 RepID=UPI000415A557|nr:hypothetical protein [Brevundimonas aveniformis]